MVDERAATRNSGSKQNIAMPLGLREGSEDQLHQQSSEKVMMTRSKTS